MKISLFSYENAALAGLLDVWADSAQPILCLVPQGRIPSQIGLQVGQYFSDAAPCAGKVYARGMLQVRVLPFVEQQRYDEMLWACDVNFVRGEDSWVRAQWAGKPFIWQVYPQYDSVHWKKLAAFVKVYSGQLSPLARGAVQNFYEAWNKGSGAGQAWPAFEESLQELQQHGQRWARQQAENNLALNLLDFSREIGRMRA